MFLTSMAYAMGQPPATGGAAGGQSGLMSFVPLVLMFVIFYFLLIRPQQKKQKETREMLKNLKRGDRIMTGGGIYGRIESLTDDTVNVEIAPNVVITCLRSYVAGMGEPGKSGKSGKNSAEKKEDKPASKE
jgi:preprotein translocase subunit YajC